MCVLLFTYSLSFCRPSHNRLFDTPTTPKTIIQKSALNKPLSGSNPANSISASEMSGNSTQQKQQPDDSELLLFGRIRTGQTPAPQKMLSGHRAFGAQLAASSTSASSSTSSSSGVALHHPKCVCVCAIFVQSAPIHARDKQKRTLRCG